MEGEKQEENAQETPPLPVLPRLDRLDRLLNLLEEKQITSGRHLCNIPVVIKTKTNEEDEEEENQCKSLTSALEEVNHKGTLMDRLAMLETRVLQLSLEMDEGNTSRSSSSTVQVSKNIIGHDLVMEKGSSHDLDAVKRPPSIQEKPSREESITTTLTEECNTNGGNKREKRKHYSKWMGWFRCGGVKHWSNDLLPDTMDSRSK